MTTVGRFTFALVMTLATMTSLCWCRHHSHAIDDERSFLQALRDVEEREENLEREERANLPRGLTAAQKKAVVDMHNKLRREEGAADMEQLVWNDQLADLAQEWTDRCYWEHRSSDARTGLFGFTNVGENMYFSHGEVQKVPKQPIDNWFNEKSDYDFGTNYCQPGKMCGHYTQVVWANTREVGCGLTKCSVMQQPGQAPARDAEFFVCNYGPGGNWADQKPYQPGPPCTACTSGQFYCTKKLCDSSCSSTGTGGACQCKATCKNCGKKTNTCGCKCMAGFSGVTCDQLCEDHDPQCNPPPGQMGWPEFFCTHESMGEQVRAGCPKMCGTCVAGNPSKCRSYSG